MVLNWFLVYVIVGLMLLRMFLPLVPDENKQGWTTSVLIIYCIFWFPCALYALAKQVTKRRA